MNTYTVRIINHTTLEAIERCEEASSAAQAMTVALRHTLHSWVVEWAGDQLTIEIVE